MFEILIVDCLFFAIIVSKDKDSSDADIQSYEDLRSENIRLRMQIAAVSGISCTCIKLNLMHYLKNYYLTEC